MQFVCHERDIVSSRLVSKQYFFCVLHSSIIEVIFKKKRLLLITCVWPSAVENCHVRDHWRTRWFSLITGTSGISICTHFFLFFPYGLRTISKEHFGFQSEAFGFASFRTVDSSYYIRSVEWLISFVGFVYYFQRFSIEGWIFHIFLFYFIFVIPKCSEVHLNIE